MPEPDVHTEHDPREPVVGHAHVDDDAVADPGAEPVEGDTPADGSATTYESAAHNGHDAPDDSSVADGSFGRDTVFGGVVAAHERPDFDQHSPDDDGAADEAPAEEPADLAPADDTDIEEPADETHVEEPADDTHVEVADDLTYTGDVADLPEHPDDGHTEVGDDAAEVEADAHADAGLAAAETVALPVPPETETPGDQALKPGAAETTPLGKLWADADVDGMRARWRELQLKFIDDPQAVAGEAESLVTEAVDALTAALNARKDELSDWRGAEDTERLRAAVRRYRDLFDQLLDL